MSNKKLGNHFETELCEILSYHEFWVHNLAQNAAGQPADVIAVKNGKAYLIDCKVCSSGKFPFSRIEDNQELAMELWKDCGNGLGWFALKFREEIYMVDMGSMINARNHHSELTQDLAEKYGHTLEEWLWVRK
jgi:Holliday junction resolvase